MRDRWDRKDRLDPRARKATWEWLDLEARKDKRVTPDPRDPWAQRETREIQDRKVI
jgi:hypothetical protein